MSIPCYSGLVFTMFRTTEPNHDKHAAYLRRGDGNQLVLSIHSVHTIYLFTLDQETTHWAALKIRFLQTVSRN